MPEAHADAETLGRPIGMAVGKTGALPISDDAGNVVWRVSAAKQGAAPADHARLPHCL